MEGSFHARNIEKPTFFFVFLIILHRICFAFQIQRQPAVLDTFFSKYCNQTKINLGKIVISFIHKNTCITKAKSFLLRFKGMSMFNTQCLIMCMILSVLCITLFMAVFFCNHAIFVAANHLD